MLERIGDETSPRHRFAGTPRKGEAMPIANLPQLLRNITQPYLGTMALTPPSSTQPTVENAADMFPADYYRTKHGILAGTLRAAHKSGRLLAAESRGKRWYYSRAAVELLYPDAFEDAN